MSEQEICPTPYLFVYGSLKSDAPSTFGATQRERLLRESLPVGRARVAGELYSLGAYPGLWLSDVSDQSVHGEIVRLKAVSSSLAWLDSYEGVGPPKSAAGYRRIKVRATLADEPRVLSAWAYVMTLRPAQDRRIADGVWR